MNYNSGINQYKKVNAQSLRTAPPQEVVRMLLSGAMDKIAFAKGAIEREHFLDRQQNIRGARQIIDALRSALNMDEGGGVAGNLDELYDYMVRRLFDANKTADIDALDEVHELLGELKTGWDQVCEQHRGSQDELAASSMVIGTA